MCYCKEHHVLLTVKKEEYLNHKDSVITLLLCCIINVIITTLNHLYIHSALSPPHVEGILQCGGVSAGSRMQRNPSEE